MHALLKPICRCLALGICLALCAAPLWARPSSSIDKYSQYAQPELSPLQQINSFTVRDLGKAPEPSVVFDQAKIVVKLLTPLNSKINREGDDVSAEVVGSSTTGGAAWLPVGTVLTGTVERASQSTYCKTDGKIYVRFYQGSVAGKVFDITSTPSTADTAIHPLKVKLSKKAKVRNVLMAATFISVPLAIGTGGIALGITAGAGAVIGGVLADDGKHVQGAINGAWEGSGLGVLDPIVKKGHQVMMPVGSTVALDLCETAEVPKSVVTLARRQAKEDANAKAVSLDTAVKIIKPIDADAVLKKCDQLLEQKDMAGALALLDQTLQSQPDNKLLVEKRQELFRQIGGVEDAANNANPGAL